jgi:uncharacterized protein (TIGR00297 family)
VGGRVRARGGPPAGAALVAFFVTSSLLSRYKARVKARPGDGGGVAQAKGGQRDAWQVLANGGVAALCLAAGGRRGSAPFLGALATAGADTWATELGLLAGRRPRLVTTGRPVPPGTSGGVTLEGSLAGVAGALVVGAAWGAAAVLERRLAERPVAGGLAPSRALLLAGVVGTAGAGADSLLGATVQGAYWCPACRAPTETPVHSRCGGETVLVRGRRWLNNDAVNALATGTGGVLGALAGGLGGAAAGR